MDDSHRQELTGRLGEAVEALSRELRGSQLDAWAALDTTLPQAKALLLLRQAGPLRMGMISSHLGRALSATTTVVDRLVEKGLVDRVSDPNDRRVVICQLTARGHEAIERFWQIDLDRVRAVAERLDPEDLERVVAGLETLRSATADIPAAE